MGFQNLDIAIRYRTNEHDFPKDFLIPVLGESVEYKRAVGFFSTSALVDLSQGLFRMAEQGGRIKLVCSSRLSEEDVKAINAGYQKREELVVHNLLNDLTEPVDEFEEERLNLVATLIAKDVMEVKLAFMETDSGISIYHEKMSVFIDRAGNRISCTGSLNETSSAFHENFESIYTFCSWKDFSQREAVRQAEYDFDAIWRNRTSKLNVIPFPQIVIDKLLTYCRGAVDYSTDYRQFLSRKEDRFYQIPAELELRPYQKEAIDNWFAQTCRGIMSMCTGAGKTFTAMAGGMRLGRDLKDALAIFIVCPFIHLVSQWEEDVVDWGYTPIIAHSKSPTPDWYDRLRVSCRQFHRSKKPFICITTNDTFSDTKIQNLIKRFDQSENVLLIVDEAHNFGAENLCASLPMNFNYRMALSATIKRHMDKAGTARLFDYFGEQCIDYGLERAIQDGVLVPYDYHPIPVYLEEDELKNYLNISKKLKRFLVSDKGKLKISDAGKSLVYARTRLLAGARAKIPLLMSLLQEYQDKRNILVYCGATTIEDEDGGEDKRQIDIATREMREKLGMSVQRFTAEENLVERQNIKEYFKDGLYQAITAIRCLDEGVNIPGISTAFILSSSRNPKQFIQRRGRLLRRSEGKEKAVIYDFVTLPRDLSEVRGESDYEDDRSIVLGELMRLHEFGLLAQNSGKTSLLIDQIMDAYHVYFDIEEEKERMEEYYGAE